jgi:hypothetical protein
MHLNQENSIWPEPSFDENDQPHFFFIITPPYSGSTALAELINTSHRTMILHPKAEGQFLIPGLHKHERWNPNKEINYQSIKASWLNRFQFVNRLTQNIDVVIEKSPPNMLIIDKLISLFHDYSFLANNRNPYANCASLLYRKYDADSISSSDRLDALSFLARGWIKRSTIVKNLVQKYNMPLMTYENFCQNPSSIISLLNLPDGVAETINPSAKVKVKDYKKQIIQNQNERQIANLKPDEIACISQILHPYSELLDFFGYQTVASV